MSEPKVSLDGPVTAVAVHEEQVRAMLAELYARLAEVTGREVDEIRDDASRGLLLTAEQAIDYGLIEWFRGGAGPGVTAASPGWADRPDRSGRLGPPRVVPPTPHQADADHHHRAPPIRIGAVTCSPRMRAAEHHGDHRVDVGVGRDERERGVAQQPDVGRERHQRPEHDQVRQRQPGPRRDGGQVHPAGLDQAAAPAASSTTPTVTIS